MPATVQSALRGSAGGNQATWKETGQKTDRGVSYAPTFARPSAPETRAIDWRVPIRWPQVTPLPLGGGLATATNGGRAPPGSRPVLLEGSPIGVRRWLVPLPA